MRKRGSGGTFKRLWKPSGGMKLRVVSAILALLLVIMLVLGLVYPLFQPQ